ncbi:electron transfer flavoprotein subunit beta [Salinisphaera sp. Q1T1-3]|uniref:electron transfer flavoprotein subunit beta n=1 Tax=Salinisphaera sp. Q1T1-3 TaxID=2321229 RepID=UPI000E76E1B0|nr:electron transfer flavoprotein subunit beta [Salinisphaera sp. Q1T1-3]RJS94413.1 electron transfer flavoprotein subunit beta [Salinisphaera sp. Q1T1-3]
MIPEITVICSLGRHPGSDRVRPAIADARALAFALSVGERVRAVHVGDPESPGLRDYLGQTAGGRSLDRLDVIELPADRDIRPALVAYLAARRCDVVLAGTCAEDGEGSGMLAYDLADALGHTLVPAIDTLASSDGGLALTQVLPRGRRRSLKAMTPLIATVDAASAPRPIYAEARARRGTIRRLAPEVACPVAEHADIRPARPRPKRIRVSGGGSAADRLRAASETQAGQGALMIDPAAEDAAQAIADYLRSEGFLSSH